MIPPAASEAKREVTAAVSARSPSFLPRYCEISPPAPIPSVNPTAWMADVSEKTTPAAPAALVPSRLTK